MYIESVNGNFSIFDSEIAIISTLYLNNNNIMT